MADLQDHLSELLHGRYRIDREVGRGGMSVVFQAEDLKHGRTVALKALRPELAAAMGGVRFLREIGIAARLQHPHILQLFDSGEADGILYYVMPFVDGATLRVALVEAGRLEIEDVVRIMRDLADAIAYAHQHGVVHRDIKPDNVVLTGRHTMLMDFGVAKAALEATQGAINTTSGMAVGTPTYMSPEQAAGDDVDHRADLYSLGIVAYEMLAGYPPFTSLSAQAVLAAHVNDAVTTVSTLRPDVPPLLESAVMRCLEKDPDKRWQSAEELISSIESLSTPAEGRPSVQRAAQRPPARKLAAGVLIVLAIAAVGLWGLTRGNAPPLRDPNLVVIAPFDVLFPSHELWREGVVDWLASGLDGAGPLRTVAPSVSIRRWTGRADAPSVTDLADEFGAGLAIYGRVLSAGTDSVRVSATLYDVEAQRPLGEIIARGPESRMDRIADSLVIGVLRELGRTRSVAAVPRAALGSHSLPALRAYLRGEQAFRRSNWDSALTYYEQAIELDSTFALAISRLSRTLAWRPDSRFDPRIQELAFRAGRLNSGLAPRESLLLTADSLFAALTGPIDSTYWRLYQRQLTTLREGQRRYPNDPEFPHRFGDALVHQGREGGAGWDAMMIAFDQSIALDSSFAPAYEHALQLSMWLNGPDVWNRYASKYLQLNPSNSEAEAIRLVQALVRNPRSDDALRGANLDVLESAFQIVARWPDPDESAIRIARFALEQSAGGEADTMWSWHLAGALSYRGHLREAFEHLMLPWPDLVAEIGLLGSVRPAEITDRLELFASMDGRGDLYAPWLAMRRDTVRIRQLLDRVPEASGSLAMFPPNLRQAYARYQGTTTQGYLALARGDTARALERFAALADSACWFCYLPRVTRVQLLAAAGRDREAQRLLQNELPTALAVGRAMDVVWALERARVNERVGNLTAAIAAYDFVVRAWEHADAELQPFVDEAREAVARIRSPR